MSNIHPCYSYINEYILLPLWSIYTTNELRQLFRLNLCIPQNFHFQLYLKVENFTSVLFNTP